MILSINILIATHIHLAFDELRGCETSFFERDFLRPCTSRKSLFSFKSMVSFLPRDWATECSILGMIFGWK